MALGEGVVDTRPLRYDDEIVLSEITSQAMLRNSSGLGLFVYADELALDVPQRGDASTPGIHECAFRVCSHQAHRAQDELDKALLANGLSPGNWRAELGPAHPMYPGISLLEHEAQKEAEANEHRRSTSRGQVVSYGDRVQLQHAWSGGLVTAVREPSEQDPQGMLIQLVRRVEEGAWFTVLSPGKILQHGSRVLNNAEIFLESVRYPGRYLALNIACASLDSKIAIEASLLPHSYIHRRLECFLGFNRQTFAARIFRREVVNSSLPRAKAGGDPHPALAVSGDGAYVAAPIPKRAISGSDIVQLYHQEEDAMLVVETATRAGASITDHDKPAERGLALFMPLQAKHQHPGAAAFHLY